MFVFHKASVILSHLVMMTFLEALNYNSILRFNNKCIYYTFLFRCVCLILLLYDLLFLFCLYFY